LAAWLKRSHPPQAAKGTVASELFFVFVVVFFGGRQDILEATLRLVTEMSGLGEV
jgi:hypothetical protein